jgi:hypothetical protein
MTPSTHPPWGSYAFRRVPSRTKPQDIRMLFVQPFERSAGQAGPARREPVAFLFRLETGDGQPPGRVGLSTMRAVRCRLRLFQFESGQPGSEAETEAVRVMSLGRASSNAPAFRSGN